MPESMVERIELFVALAEAALRSLLWQSCVLLLSMS